MRVLRLLVGVPVAIVALAWGVGLLIPRDHVAQVRIDLAAGPGQVWGLITDFSGTPRWRQEVTAVRMHAGPGAAVRFTETTADGDVTFELASQDPPVRQVVRVVDDDQPFGGTWTWELEAAGGGTRLTLTERGFIKSPFVRVIGAVLFSPTDSLVAYQRALATALGESAEPVIVEHPRVD